jgi:hypothetical protein
MKVLGGEQMRLFPVVSGVPNMNSLRICPGSNFPRYFQVFQKGI